MHYLWLLIYYVRLYVPFINFGYISSPIRFLYFNFLYFPHFGLITGSLILHNTTSNRLFTANVDLTKLSARGQDEVDAESLGMSPWTAD